MRTSQVREALLILDTCEHIAEPVAMLAELMLSRCSNLKLLATSREALRAAEEWTHRLPSIAFPQEGVEVREKDITNLRVGRSNRSGRAIYLRSVPDTWVTFHSEDIGNTFGPKGFASGSSLHVSSSKYPRS
jgi:hypothetical protein